MAIRQRTPDLAQSEGLRTMKREAARFGHRALRVPPQSSSASRFTAGAAGFLILSQWLTRPDRYGEPTGRFNTMPSQPRLQACYFRSSLPMKNVFAACAKAIGQKVTDDDQKNTAALLGF